MSIKPVVRNNKEQVDADVFMAQGGDVKPEHEEQYVMLLRIPPRLNKKIEIRRNNCDLKMSKTMFILAILADALKD